MSNMIAECFNGYKFEDALQYINKDNINIPFLDGKTILYKSLQLDLGIGYIKKLLQKGADVNFIPKEKFDSEIDSFTFANPLKTALILGQTETAKLLLENGAAINEPFTIDTIYEYIMKLTNEENKLLECFLEHGLSFNMTDKSGKNLLHYAVISHNPYAVKKVLELSAININCKDINERTPIELLLLSEKIENHQNYIKIIDILLEKGAVISPSILFDYIKLKDTAHLFFNRENPEECQRTLILKKLISVIPDINIKDIDGRNLLSWVIYKKEPDNIQLLLRKGIDYEEKDRFKLSPKDYINHLFPEADCLIHDKDSDLIDCYHALEDEDKIFEYYISENKQGLCDYLDKHKININSHFRHFGGRILDFMTHHIMADKSEAFYKILLQHGADPNLRRINYNYHTQKYGNKCPFQVLLDNFNPDTDLGTLYYMLKYSKNKNITDSKNNTLPMVVLQKGDYLKDAAIQDILDKYFKSFKFDLDLKNNENKTFFDLLEQLRPELIFNYQHLLSDSSSSISMK